MVPICSTWEHEVLIYLGEKEQLVPLCSTYYKSGWKLVTNPVIYLLHIRLIFITNPVVITYHVDFYYKSGWYYKSCCLLQIRVIQRLKPIYMYDAGDLKTECLRGNEIFGKRSLTIGTNVPFHSCSSQEERFWATGSSL